LNEEDSFPIIERALQLGVNFFDTADVYSFGASETVIGDAIKKFVPNREDVVIATKCYFGLKRANTNTVNPNGSGLSRKHIMEACNASLQRLGMDYVDLYQIHRWDYDTPIEETMEALHDLVKCGKVLYIGASSMHAWQFAKAQNIAKQRGFSQFISMQNHYNLIYREEEREMIPQCLDMGVGLIPWSPLAAGLLTGSRKKGQDRPAEGDTARAKSDKFVNNFYLKSSTKDNDFEIIDRVNQLSAKKQIPSAQIALSWVLNKPGVVAPIIGASKVSHLEDAVAALDVKLTEEDVKFLEEIYRPKPISGHV